MGNKNKKSMSLSNHQRESLYGFAFILIWLIGFIVLTAIPMVDSLVYSFNRITIAGGEGIRLDFIGWDNFILIFTGDLEFLTALQAFIVEMVLYVPIIIILALIIALLLNHPFKFRGFFRSIFFLPVIIASGPVIAELMRQGAGTIPALADQNIAGLLLAFLPPWLANPIASLFQEIIMILWFSGVQVILFLAGLQKLDKAMYEAAQIDGANAWETFWKITLPSLKSIILVSAIYTIVTLATFSNNPIIIFISRAMFDPNKGYGYASALAWIYFFVITIFLVLVTVLIVPKDQGYRVVKQIERLKR